ncbi:MAG: hypothetical protein RL685_1632 [Pseudomonadota bacterium]|jgi:hypothetical protein
MNHHGVRALFLVALVGACSDRDSALNESTGRPSPEPKPVPFTWRRAGGETTDFGGNDVPTCEGSASPISQQQASERGFDVAATLAQIEGVVQADLVWSEGSCYEANSCPHTGVTIATRLESIALITRTLQPGASDPGEECQDGLEYVLNVELSTADGSLAGSFRSHVFSWLRTVDGGWNGAGVIALTDLRGTRQLAVDMTRPHWNEVQVGLHWGAQLTGELEATILYTDEEAPREQRSLSAAWSSAEPAALANGDPLQTGPDSIPLEDYQGSTIPATFEVEALPELEQPGSRLRVTLNGEVTSFDPIPEGQVLTLGRRSIGDVVSAEVIDNQGSYVRSILRVGECTWAYESCSTPGCTARAEVTVTPKRCYPELYD